MRRPLLLSPFVRRVGFLSRSFLGPRVGAGAGVGVGSGATGAGAGSGVGTGSGAGVGSGTSTATDSGVGVGSCTTPSFSVAPNPLEEAFLRFRLGGELSGNPEVSSSFSMIKCCWM